jgi:hypothetical protein
VRGAADGCRAWHAVQQRFDMQQRHLLRGRLLRDLRLVEPCKLPLGLLLQRPSNGHMQLGPLSSGHRKHRCAGRGLRRQHRLRIALLRSRHLHPALHSRGRHTVPHWLCMPGRCLRGLRFVSAGVSARRCLHDERGLLLGHLRASGWYSVLHRLLRCSGAVSCRFRMRCRRRDALSLRAQPRWPRCTMHRARSVCSEPLRRHRH